MNVENKYIKDVANLVPMPDIALDVLKIAHDMDCDMNKLIRKVERDLSLTANMLRMANSAYVGLPNKVTSTRDIVVLLGLETVKLMAISSASVGVLKTPQDAYKLEPEELWNHSYATAILAEVIGKYAGCEDLPSLYTAALLHDMGKVLLNRPLHLEMLKQDILELGVEDAVYEQQLLKTDHARVGATLLQGWGLPKRVTEPVRIHHSHAEIKTSSLHCRVIYLANRLEKNLGLHRGEPIENTGINLGQDMEVEHCSSVPGFSENWDAIVSEAYERYFETASVFEL